MPAGNRPRWILHIQAQFWRVLMGIGMLLHRLARPLPPSPSFQREVEATISPLKGKFRLKFYVPRDYKANKKLKGKRYPCVVNFHGGGFVLGTAQDDARWSGTVVKEVNAVVVSVDYRLAPEYPFPTAVEDGADAILYLAQHANELHLDTERFAVSGFSSGGNMSFTVPLCLQGELLSRKLSSAKTDSSSPVGNTPKIQYILKADSATQLLKGQSPNQLSRQSSAVPLVKLDTPAQVHLNGHTININDSPNSSRIPLVKLDSLAQASNQAQNHSQTQIPNQIHLALPTDSPNASRIPLTRHTSRLDRIAMLRQTGTSTLSLVSSYKEGPAVSVSSGDIRLKIRGIISFYPPTDYTVTRAQRRQTCIRPDQNLPAVFTELFDDSYLQPPSMDLAHPWLSPGQAPREMLQALPDDIALFCCEWDMLLAEGERFRDRLTKELGKRVHYHCVPGVPHGWDKAPNPLRESPGARDQYLIACRELRRMFGVGDEDGDDV